MEYALYLPRVPASNPFPTLAPLNLLAAVAA